MARPRSSPRRTRFASLPKPVWSGRSVAFPKRVRYRYLLGGGRLHAISTHPLGFLLAGYLSPLERLRLLAEPFVGRRADGAEESVADFVTRRFGRAMANRVMDPLVGGLFAGRAEEVSVAAVFPRLVEMERRFGSVTLGVLDSLRARRLMPGRRLFAFRDGIGTLPRTLAASLGTAVATSQPVRRIQRGAGGFKIAIGQGASLEARALVLATQPHIAAGLLENLDPHAAEAAYGVDAPPLAVVFLGYRRDQIAHPLDGLGYLTPAREGRALSGALFGSTMYPDRAPDGHVALCAYLGGDRAPDLALRPADELMALVRDEFRDLLGAKGPPVLARVRQWPRGLPQYRLGHGRRIAAIRDGEARQPGLFVTGNYFTGPGIARCLEEAEGTAERVSDFLAGRSENVPETPGLSSQSGSL